MKNLAASAKKMIKENLYMTVATANRKGRPWVSPVYFACDSKFNFYWSSAKSSLHSRLIKSNSSVAVVVFNSAAAEGTGDGVYMAGKAKEVKGLDISYALELLRNRTGAANKYFENCTPDDYKGKSPVRLYKFVPVKFWVLGKLIKIKGKLVDVRREVHLK